MWNLYFREGSGSAQGVRLPWKTVYTAKKECAPSREQGLSWAVWESLGVGVTLLAHVLELGAGGGA